MRKESEPRTRSQSPPSPPSSTASAKKKPHTHRRAHPEIPSITSALSAHYDIINKLGRGSVGTVFQAMDRQYRRLHAIKVVRKAALTDSLSEMSVRREITALKSLHHKHILRLHHIHEDRDFLFIATEYCSQGDLVTQLRRLSVGFSEFRAVTVMRQVFSALKYMHARGVSHRDIKLANILLAPDGSVRLADFGLVHWRRSDDTPTSARRCGTAEYAAPEVLRGTTYSPQIADMWACGITLYVLLTRTCPFEPAQLASADRNVVPALIQSTIQDHALSHVSPHCRKLLVGLLQPNPKRRISTVAAATLCDHILDNVSTSSSSSWS